MIKWIFLILICVTISAQNHKILVTGYWPPTNEMVKSFSQDSVLNPEGWQGKNWKNLGYDIYSFFPKFSGELGKGEGNFEVDYQDTSKDFWRIVNEIKPIAIISFGLGKGPWEIEVNARNLPENVWRPDYFPPKTPASKPDKNREDDFVLHSSLPVDKIAEKINQSRVGVEAWVDKEGNPGAFLCEYMAYHVMWYQDLHSTTTDPNRCVAAGFIHVGNEVSSEQAKALLYITLYETICHINDVLSLAEDKTSE